MKLLSRLIPVAIARWLVALVAVAACGSAAAEESAPATAIVLQPLTDTAFWTFTKHAGDGRLDRRHDPDGDVLEFESSGEQGMAATVSSPALPVDAGREYLVRMEIKTEGLVPVDPHAPPFENRMTGGAYFLFQDPAGRPGSFFPSIGTEAPRTTGWKEVVHRIKTPTTAGKARIFLVYSGYGDWTGGIPRVSGRARGRLWIRRVRVETGGKIPVLPALLHVPDPVIQAGIDTATECLHNASLNGRFEVSDGYTISGNIVPDLSFGLFGARRAGHDEYMKRFGDQWRKLAAQFDPSGRLKSQRVMSQVFFPLGVDEIFSFTGDRAFLAAMLPVADRSLAYVAARADANGLARLVESGTWRIGEGADWVDWYPQRMEGKTLMFHLWYARALRRMASLHAEFAGDFGNAALAAEYRDRAERVEESLRRLYWKGDHFVTNIDFQGKVADGTWCDDQVWAIAWGVATAEQAGRIWEWVNSDPARYEGVPMSWAAFDGPAHGRSSWFGRLGAGDILARFRSGQDRRAMELLHRISTIFARDRNIHEAYDMAGNPVQGSAGGGNYTEHAGGYYWSVVGGPFGIDFDPQDGALATVRPRFPSSWTQADAVFVVRGSHLRLSYTADRWTQKLTFEGEGEPRAIRVITPDGKIRLLTVGPGKPKTVKY